MNRILMTRVEAIKSYWAGRPLKEVAAEFNIHPVTLRRWARWYEKIAKGNYNNELFLKPWNRPSRVVEQKVVSIKENNPALTLEKARQILEKEGIVISLKGISYIWQRYNLVKRKINDLFSPFGVATAETKWVLEYLKNSIHRWDDKNSLKMAARIINNLPSCSADYEEILQAIPDRFLSTKRRLEKLYTYFLKIPMPKFYKQIKKIREELEKKNLYYSSIIAGLIEVLALHYMRTPAQEIELISVLKKRKGKLYDPLLEFALTVHQGMAHAQLLQVEEAYRCAQQCRRVLRLYPTSSVLESFGNLMTFLTEYKKALSFHQLALEKELTEEARKRLLIKIALGFVSTGEYRKAHKIFTSALKIKEQEKYFDIYSIIQGQLFFGLGNLEKAKYFLIQGLEKSQKEHYRNSLFAATLCLASSMAALGKIHEAKGLLKKYLPLFQKYHMNGEIKIIDFIAHQTPPEKKIRKLPQFYLFYLLGRARRKRKAQDLKCAFLFAKKKGLLGFFHRCIVFFPEIIATLFEKNMVKYLPRTIINFPIFNKELLTYSINFLGKPIIIRKNKCLNVILSPKELGLLGFICEKCCSPGAFSLVEEIYANFWPRSSKPAERLTHLLVQLRHKLKIPSHLLFITWAYGEKRIVNRGIYFITDYQDFRSLIVQAKVLQRAGEWGFARKEYLRAFKLFRGEPFKKNFDNWS
ncbi:MAG: helix-turn-helix domain-containing protein, partial [candidate division WOR-3 bacterium]